MLFSLRAGSVESEDVLSSLLKLLNERALFSLRAGGVESEDVLSSLLKLLNERAVLLACRRR